MTLTLIPTSTYSDHILADIFCDSWQNSGQILSRQSKMILEGAEHHKKESQVAVDRPQASYRSDIQEDQDDSGL